MHGGGSAPSCCAFTHRVAFEEVSGHRVLMKSGLINRGRSAFGTTHVAHLEFPRETSIILRCAGKAGNTFHTKKGNRLDRKSAVRPFRLFGESMQKAAPSFLQRRSQIVSHGGPVGAGEGGEEKREGKVFPASSHCRGPP